MLSQIAGTDVIVISSQDFGSDVVRTTKLMNHLAQGRRVFFFTKPIVGVTKKSTVYYNKESHKVTVVQPYLPYESDDMLIDLIKDFKKEEKIRNLTLWTDTPSTLPFVRSLKPDVMVYDKKFGSWELLDNVSDIVIDPVVSTDQLIKEIETLNDEHGSRIYLNNPTDLIVQERMSHPMTATKAPNLVAHYLVG